MTYDILESAILTTVKAKLDPSIKKAYPTISFISDIPDAEPTMPNVYIYEMNSPEVGTDLNSNEINAMNSTFQVQISAKTKKTDAKKIAWAVVDVFKRLGYEIIASPIYSKNTVYQYTFRARRVLATGDLL